jgi:hypothetical protein
MSARHRISRPLQRITKAVFGCVAVDADAAVGHIELKLCLRVDGGDGFLDGGFAMAAAHIRDGESRHEASGVLTLYQGILRWKVKQKMQPAGLDLPVTGTLM